jgi:hypothetical protein
MNIAYAVDCGPGLRVISDAPCGDPRPTRQLGATTSACLAYLFARSRGEREAETDAFEHLMAIMLTATAGLFIPEDVRSLDEDTAKYRFIRQFLVNELEAWRSKTTEEIEAAALAGKFRHWGNRCRCRVLNRIRDTLRAGKTQFYRYNDEWVTHQPEGRAAVEPSLFETIVSRCDFLTPREIQIAKAVFGLRHEKRTKWAALLATQRAVSVQTGRKYIRVLQQKCQMAVREGHRAAHQLFELLSGEPDG